MIGMHHGWQTWDMHANFELETRKKLDYLAPPCFKKILSVFSSLNVQTKSRSHTEQEYKYLFFNCTVDIQLQNQRQLEECWKCFFQMLMTADWSSSKHCAFVVQNDNGCPTAWRPPATARGQPVW
jgi:hypothetical protein